MATELRRAYFFATSDTYVLQSFNPDNEKGIEGMLKPMFSPANMPD